MHQLTLNPFGNIGQLGSSEPPYQLASRQMACKDIRAGSWFSHVWSIALIYNTDLHSCLNHPWSKDSWKIYCKNTICDCWWNKLQSNTVERSTIQRIIWDSTYNGCHSLWQTCSSWPDLTEAAATRTRIMACEQKVEDEDWRRHLISSVPRWRRRHQPFPYKLQPTPNIWLKMTNQFLSCVCHVSS